MEIPVTIIGSGKGMHAAFTKGSLHWSISKNL